MISFAIGDELDDLRSVALDRFGVQLPKRFSVVGSVEFELIQRGRVSEIESVRRSKPLFERLVLFDRQEMEDTAAVVVQTDDRRVDIGACDREQPVHIVVVRQIARDENQRIVGPVAGTERRRRDPIDAGRPAVAEYGQPFRSRAGETVEIPYRHRVRNEYRRRIRDEIDRVSHDSALGRFVSLYGRPVFVLYSFESVSEGVPLAIDTLRQVDSQFRLVGHDEIGSSERRFPPAAGRIHDELRSRSVP